VAAAVKDPRLDLQVDQVVVVAIIPGAQGLLARVFAVVIRLALEVATTL
jgi:hypothetical protein